MSTRAHDAVARGLARALLAADWERPALVEAVERAADGRAPWAGELVERVLGRFGRHPPRPRYEALWRLIQADPIFEGAYRKRAARKSRRRSWLREPTLKRRIFDAPSFEPGRAARTWRALEIGSVPQLADMLGIPLSSLEGWADVGGWLADTPVGPLQHYHRYWLGRPGEGRLIEAPKDQLRKMQRFVLRNVLEAVPSHPSAHGFVPGRSVRTHAAGHIGRAVVIRADLRCFFTTISAGRIRGIYRYIGYPESVADGQRQSLCGVVVNERPNLPRREWDRLRAIIHRSAREGPESQNHDGHPDFRNHLRGRVSYAEMIDARRGEALRRRFEALEWSDVNETRR